MKSESIKELAAALCKAQSELSGAKKTSENPFFKSSYADLASVWETARGPLSKHGLSVTQTTELLPFGDVRQLVLTTTLMHVSGEWTDGSYPINPIKNDPQGMGSAITYARRYALMAIVGIAPEEDDGTAASHPHQQRPANPPRQATSQQQKSHEPFPFEKELENVGEYLVKIGKEGGDVRNKKLKDIPNDRIASFMLYLENESHKKNDPLKGFALEFCKYAKIYLEDLAMRQQ